MRIAAKSELQRVESPVETIGAALVAAVPLDMAVLKAGLTGEREVASHIQE
jgi:hypothetical protein